MISRTCIGVPPESEIRRRLQSGGQEAATVRPHQHHARAGVVRHLVEVCSAFETSDAGCDLEILLGIDSGRRKCQSLPRVAASIVHLKKRLSGFKTVVAQGFSPASGSPKGLRYSFETICSRRHEIADQLPRSWRRATASAG
jgi:hypothetical protein